MTPQSAKAKGRKLQQWVVDKLLTTNPELSKDDVRSTSMGAQGEDVQLSPAARKMFPYQVECKNKATFSVYKDYEQGCTHGNHQPLLVIKADRKRPLVLVDAEYFFELTRLNYENYKSH